MKWLWILVLTFFGLGTKNNIDPMSGYVIPTIAVSPTVMLVSPTNKAVLKPTSVTRAKMVGDTSPWGVAKQIGEDTWTMRVGHDPKMSTPKEVLAALNVYRTRKGVQPLAWDEKLANYAQSRADYFAKIKNIDGHKGFNDYLEKEDGFDKLGFSWLGENISYGYQLEGVHLIEWLYAGDKPHDDNQLNSRWNYVGVGINGTATSIIFGTGKK